MVELDLHWTGRLYAGAEYEVMAALWNEVIALLAAAQQNGSVHVTFGMGAIARRDGST
jgi:hypothetical protein